MVLALKDTADFPIPTKNIIDNDANFNYNTSGSINAYDRTYLDIINASRTFFFPPANVLVERSTDGGSTWTTVDTSTYTAQQRGNLLCGVGASLPIGTGNASTSQQLRVTLQYPGTAWYCSLDRAYIRWSIAGHSNTVKIQASTYGAQSTYTDITGDTPISGWSGDNMIKFSNRTAWGTNNSGHLYNIRFIFKYSSVNSSYISSQANVIKIAMFGMDFWGTTGTPRSYGHLYNWDYLQNVTFPAKVTSTNFTAPAHKATGSAYPHIQGNGSILTLSGTGGWYSGAGCLVLQNNALRPGGNDSGALDLGNNEGRWRNLNLTGNISNGTYNYTLPSATGTLALKSEVPTSFSDLSGTISSNQIDWTSVIDKIYPVGSIYMSTNNVSPQSFLGGTWESIKDTFLLSAGDTYTAGSTGGNATHNHSLSAKGAAGIRVSGNKMYYSSGTSDSQSIYGATGSAWQGSFSNSESAYTGTVKGIKLYGVTDDTTNLPPYLVVYVWKRTA